MKRRSFLAMLGLAPVAGAAGAVAAPQTEINWKAIESTQIGNLVSQAAIDEHQDWISEGTRELINDARAIVRDQIANDIPLFDPRRDDFASFAAPITSRG